MGGMAGGNALDKVQGSAPRTPSTASPRGWIPVQGQRSHNWSDSKGEAAKKQCLWKWSWRSSAKTWRSRQLQETLRACNQTFQYTVEHFNYMRAKNKTNEYFSCKNYMWVGVGASMFVCVCVFLLLYRSDYKPWWNITRLNCYVEVCQVFVVLQYTHLVESIRCEQSSRYSPTSSIKPVEILSRKSESRRPGNKENSWV